MFKKYIMLFVLVMVMIKANGQTYPFYYYEDSYVELQENDDRLVIQLNPDMSQQEISDFLTLVANDPNCNMVSSMMSIYVMLERKPNNTETKANIIAYYINEDYVDYISFIFNHAGGGFQAITNHVAVMPNTGVTESEVEDYADDYNLLYMEEDENYSGLYHLYFSKSGSYNTLEIANLLFETEDFEFATPDFFRSYAPAGYTSANCAAPSLNDPHFSSQWGVYNSNATSATNTQWADVNACYAWNYNTGGGTLPANLFWNGSPSSPVMVAIIDDGIDTRHPDYTYNGPGLINNSWNHVKCLSTVCTPVHADDGCASSASTHGTRCAGIVSAVQNNAAGISGVAPGTKVASQRIGYFDPSLNAHLTSDQWCYDGILMVNITGIVRLCPWTFNGGPSLLIDHAINISSGGDIIFPTGNNNTSTISYPGNNPNVTAVGAMSMCNERKSINSCDQSTLFPGSNYGPMTGPGTAGKISIVAPGVNIYTTDVSWGTSSYLSNFYGTSAAASFVAGIYAMIRSENWCMDGFEIRNLIEQTADKVGGYSYSFTGLNGSWDPEMGYGRINAGNALVWAHDIYRQNEQVNVSKSYKSQHKIFAGENVDPLGIKGVGSYSILSTTSINFEAVEGIDLEPGFEALSGSAFTAKIITSYTCTTGYAHFKGPKKNTPILKYTRPKTTESEDLSSIKIYPNPVNDVLHVSFVLDTESKVEFSIRNIMGQRIGNNFKVDNYPKGRNIQTLSTINLVPGVYIVDIKTNSGTSHFRFVKE